jgi:hypothetical protein
VCEKRTIYDCCIFENWKCNRKSVRHSLRRTAVLISRAMRGGLLPHTTFMPKIKCWGGYLGYKNQTLLLAVCIVEPYHLRDRVSWVCSTPPNAKLGHGPTYLFLQVPIWLLPVDSIDVEEYADTNQLHLPRVLCWEDAPWIGGRPSLHLSQKSDLVLKFGPKLIFEV